MMVSQDRTSSATVGAEPWDTSWAAERAAEALCYLGRNYPECLENLRVLDEHETDFGLLWDHERQVWTARGFAFDGSESSAESSAGTHDAA